MRFVLVLQWGVLVPFLELFRLFQHLVVEINPKQVILLQGGCAYPFRSCCNSSPTGSCSTPCMTDAKKLPAQFRSCSWSFLIVIFMLSHCCCFVKCSNKHCFNQQNNIQESLKYLLSEE